MNERHCPATCLGARKTVGHARTTFYQDKDKDLVKGLVKVFGRKRVSSAFVWVVQSLQPD